MQFGNLGGSAVVKQFLHHIVSEYVIYEFMQGRHYFSEYSSLVRVRGHLELLLDET